MRLQKESSGCSKKKCQLIVTLYSHFCWPLLLLLLLLPEPMYKSVSVPFPLLFSGQLWFIDQKIKWTHKHTDARTHPNKNAAQKFIMLQINFIDMRFVQIDRPFICIHHAVGTFFSTGFWYVRLVYFNCGFSFFGWAYHTICVICCGI